MTVTAKNTIKYMRKASSVITIKLLDVVEPQNLPPATYSDTADPYIQACSVLATVTDLSRSISLYKRVIRFTIRTALK